MKLRYAEPNLHELDGEQAVCLVLTAFADDRPLRGLAGRVDWRLNGQLSRLMLRRFVDGHFCEAMLTPLVDRLPFQRLLLVGMGTRAAFNERRFADICRFTFDTLSRMHITDFAMAMPGRIGLDVGLRQALNGWEDGIASAFPAEMIQQLNICLIESSEVQRELIEPLRRSCRDLDDRAAAALRVAESRTLAPETETVSSLAPTAPTPAIEEPSPARGRDWSTGMFRINEESALPEEDDEINVADVPATKRRSGLFTIPEARGGAERQRPTTEPTLARDDRQAGWRNTPAGTPRANDGQRRAAEFTGARRPSGQFAAMRRSAGQYDIPSRRVPADFNAPPVAPPSEPVDRVRQRTTGGYAARSESAPSDQPPTRRPITRPQGSLAKSETREDAPWAPSQPTEHPPGVHVDPPLLETGPHNEPRLSEEFRRAQAAQLPNGDADW